MRRNASPKKPQPPIIPANLGPGRHFICDAPEKYTDSFSIITDRIARFGFWVPSRKGGQFIIDGNPKPKTPSEFLTAQFAPDGLAYAYEISGQENSLVLNDRTIPQANSLVFHGSAKRWTYRKQRKHGYFLVSPRGMHPFEIGGEECMSPNGKHLIYSPHRGLVCDNRLIFEGSAENVQPSNKRPYASWIGVPEHEMEPFHQYVYLLGKQKERVPYYEVLTFAVSENHKHYMYGGAPANVEDEMGNFIGEQFLYVDGHRESRPFREIMFWENMFSPKVDKWTFIGRDAEDKEHSYVMKKKMGTYDQCSNNHFSSKGNRHGFIGHWGAGDKISDEWVRKSSEVVVDGRVYNPKEMVVFRSLHFSPDEKHFAFLGYQVNADRKLESMRVYLDGKQVHEAEECFGSKQEFIGHDSNVPEFSPDSSRLYFFSVEDHKLYFNVISIR